MKITQIIARQIFDSRGNPTIEVEVSTKKNTARAAVPSGASTGIYEAIELRDKEKPYNGQGVSKAVANVNTIIAPKLIGLACNKQKAIDKLMIELDTTPNKAKLGANAILGVSLAVCRLAAMEKKIPLYSYIALLAKNENLKLPVPCLNIINGGKHADNGLSVQECMIVPVGANTFTQAMQMATEVYHILKKEIKARFGGQATAIGDEGGFAPPVKTTREALDLITASIQKAGYEGKIAIAIDAAASEYYEEKMYKYEGKLLTGDMLVDEYTSLINSYDIVSFEDPFDQDDFLHYAKLKTAVSPKCQIVGDDLLVTNVDRIKKASKASCCNALLLKVNQIGSVTEAINASLLASKLGWKTMVSHRSGETEDTFIADLAVGLGAGQIKTGAPCRSERVAKYNQLLRIEEQLNAQGQKAVYGPFK